MKRIFTLLSAAVCLSAAARAQAPTPPCASDSYNAELMALNPAFAASVQAFDAAWMQSQLNAAPALVTNTPNGPFYEIPVVVHVIHSGQAVGHPLNPSDAQIQNWLNYVNQTFAATYSGYASVANGGTAFPVKFVLAKRDTNCTSINGIFRVNGSVLTGYAANGVNRDNTNGADDDDVKALSFRNNLQYYNIWVVTEIDNNNGGSGVQGYANYPPAGFFNRDGTVMMASTIQVGNSTGPHELGHAFNLRHTFEGSTGSTSCPTGTNCATSGDLVCDTDPHPLVYNCPTGTNPCTGNSWVPVIYNIMGYSNCENRFTAGQRTRFLAALNTGSRAMLASSLAGQPVGTPPASACTPTITNASTSANAGPRNVTFNTLFSMSSGYNGDGNRVYIDRSCTYGTEVTAGQSYSLTVTTGANHQVRAFIDYNNDGDFADAGEQIFQSTTGSTHTGSIAIPSTATLCAPLRMRVVADLSSASAVTACGPLTSGQAEDFMVFVRAAPAPVSIALTSGGNPSCSGTQLTFTATPGTGVTATGVTWLVNGQAVTVGVSGLTFTSSTLANGDVVSLKMFYTGPCGADSSVSNSITVIRSSSVPATVTAAITAGSNPGCPGQPITFTATGTNTGTAPIYQWLVDGQPVSGATGTVFTTATLTAGQTVSVFLLSNSSCANPASATSTPITIVFGSVTPAVTIAQTAGSTPLCAGKPATFTATPTGGGTAPTYTWFVNGNGVPGVTGNQFTTSSLQNGDTIRVLITSNSPCANPTTALSNGLGVIVAPTDTPTLSVVLTAGSNPGCKDSLLSWTATVTKLGSLPNIQWFVNNVVVGSGTTFSSTSLQNGSILRVRATAGTSGCRTTDTLFSAPINIVRDTVPAAPLISYIGSNLVSDLSPVQWYGPNGLIPGATSATYQPMVEGWYYATAVNGSCASLPSNKLMVSLLDIAARNMGDVRVFPNPTKNSVTIDWGKATTAELSVCNTVGQVLMRDKLTNASTKTLDLSRLTPGMYYIVVKSEEGGIGALPVTLMR